MKTELSVVAPAHCECVILPRFIHALEKAIEPLGMAYEIIIVDDGSTDDTWDTLSELTKSRPHLELIRFSRQFGKEAAIAAGLNAARGVAIVVLDSDLQHPPTLIPEMVRLWRTGDFGLVEAIKSQRQPESYVSRWMAWFFHYLFLRWTGIDLFGSTDFKLLDRRFLEAWRQIGENTLFFRGISVWLGFRHTQVSFTPPERTHGKTRWSFITRMGLAVRALTAFTPLPLLLIWLTALVLLLLGVTLGFQTLYLKFFGQAVSGFTTVILLQLIIGGMVTFNLALIATYLYRIYQEVKRRPRYIIEKHVIRKTTDAL